MYQLFIFFMITDPKTTVRSKTGQCVVVFVVAPVEMVLRLNQSVYAPYYALFIVGPTALLIEMWLDSRRPAANPAHAASFAKSIVDRARRDSHRARYRITVATRRGPR